MTAEVVYVHVILVEDMADNFNVSTAYDVLREKISRRILIYYQA